jgi:hypothetical protein
MADDKHRGGRCTWPVHDQFPDIDWENVGKQVLVYGDKIALTIKPTNSFIVKCRCCGKAQACGAYIRHRISQPCPNGTRPFIRGRYVSFGHANDTTHFFRTFMRDEALTMEGLRHRPQRRGVLRPPLGVDQLGVVLRPPQLHVHRVIRRVDSPHCPLPRRRHVRAMAGARPQRD